MIHPRQAWCHQIEVTNVCQRACSNCTRCIPYGDDFFISLEDFSQCLDAVKNFPELGEPGPNMNNYGRKVVGMMGGEPTLHPEFPKLCEMMRIAIPDINNRGLWTGSKPGMAKYEKIIHQTFGPASNINFHDPPSMHQPVLVAIGDLVQAGAFDTQEMWRLINNCWVQRIWSGTFTARGFFFCEVAGALDWVFHGPGGEPLSPDCWRHDIDHYDYQIEWACVRCGCCVPLPGRQDNERRDDISPLNFHALKRLGKLSGREAPFDCETYVRESNWQPNLYRSEQRL